MNEKYGNPIDPAIALAVIRLMIRLMKELQVVEMLEERAKRSPNPLDDLGTAMLKRALQIFDE